MYLKIFFTKADLSVFFSAFYGQPSVEAAWTNHSPWSILNSFYTTLPVIFKFIFYLIFLQKIMSVICAGTIYNSELWEYFLSEKLTDMTIIGSDGLVRSHLAIINHFYPPIGEVLEGHFVNCDEIFISIPDFSKNR